MSDDPAAGFQLDPRLAADTTFVADWKLCRVLLMDDEKGVDEKILAVPVDALNPFYKDVQTHDDLPPLLVAQIKHFFQHYKDLEPGKMASVGEWASLEVAHERINLAIKRKK